MREETIFLCSFQLKERVDKYCFLSLPHFLYIRWNTHMAASLTTFFFSLSFCLPLFSIFSFFLSDCIKFEWRGKRVWRVILGTKLQASIFSHMSCQDKGKNNPLHPTHSHMCKSPSVQKLIKNFIFNIFLKVSWPDLGNKIVRTNKLHRII